MSIYNTQSTSGQGSVGTAAYKKGKGGKILFIPLEFQEWFRAKHLSYASFLGLEDGFRDSNLDVTILPANIRHSAGEGIGQQPGYWLDSIRTLCQGKKFDQVWVEVVHSNLDEDTLNFLASLAPIRIAMVGESLEYAVDVKNQHPHLAGRKSLVEGRLRTFTHALVADEKDAADLNARGLIKAMWLPASIPEKCIGTIHALEPKGSAIFSDASERELSPWADQGTLSGKIHVQTISEKERPLAKQFDDIHAHLIKSVGAGKISWEHVGAYLDVLRAIRSETFRLRLEALSSGNAVVNLPSYFQGYGVRVFEGMAAGRPLISWDVPDRPRNRALFVEGEEILLFQNGRSDQLQAHIEKLQGDSAYAVRLARNATRKLWRFHTSEKRIRQVLFWLEQGEKQLFEDMDLAPPLGIAIEAFRKRFNAVVVSPLVAVGATLVERLLKAEALATQGNFNAAIDILEAASKLDSENVQIHKTMAEIYSRMKDFKNATMSYLQAIQLDENDISLWLDCARASVEEGNLQMAIASVDGALTIDPNNNEAKLFHKNLHEKGTPGTSSGAGLDKTKIDGFYEDFFLHSTEYQSPNPNPEEEIRWSKIEIFLRKSRDEHQAQDKGPLRILDLGCGRGWLTNLCSKYGTCEGMEPVAGVIKGARRLFPALTFYACDAAQLRQDPSFRPYDLIVNSEVIEHVPWPHKDAFVDTMKSLLVPGGTIILTTPRGEVFDDYMRLVNYSRQPIEDWTTEEQTLAYFKNRGFTFEGPERIWARFPQCVYSPAATLEQEKSGLMPIYQIWRFQLGR